MHHGLRAFIAATDSLTKRISDEHTKVDWKFLSEDWHQYRKIFNLKKSAEKHFSYKSWYRSTAGTEDSLEISSTAFYLKQMYCQHQRGEPGLCLADPRKPPNCNWRWGNVSANIPDMSTPTQVWKSSKARMAFFLHSSRIFCDVSPQRCLASDSQYSLTSMQSD